MFVWVVLVVLEFGVLKKESIWETVLVFAAALFFVFLLITFLPSELREKLVLEKSITFYTFFVKKSFKTWHFLQNTNLKGHLEKLKVILINIRFSNIYLLNITIYQTGK